MSAEGGLLGVPSFPLTEGGCVGARRGIWDMRVPKDSVSLYEGGFLGRAGISGDVCVLGSAVVRMFHYTIDDRVAEVHVRVGHIDFGTQHHGAFFHFAAVHLFEQSQALFGRAVSVRAVGAGLSRCEIGRAHV